MFVGIKRVLGWQQPKGRLPALGVGEEYCPDCEGLGKTYWSVPALGQRCGRCRGTGKVCSSTRSETDAS